MIDGQKMRKNIQDLDNQLATYKAVYTNSIMACLKSGDSSKRMFLATEFNMQTLYAFIDLYETKYPERKQSFLKFFRGTNNMFFEHMAKIKCMSYMLDEKVIAKMTEWMNKRNGIYIQFFPHANPAPHGASAYFGRDFWGRPRIMYYDIERKGQLNPPYKTFFHEFGHALDFLTVRGRGFLSDCFQHTMEVEDKQLCMDQLAYPIGMQKIKKMETKTIHEWAELDVQNAIIQTCMDLLQEKISVSSCKRYLSPAMTPLKKYHMINFVTHHLFLKPDGCRRLASLSGKPYFKPISDLYHDVAEVMNKTIFASHKNIIVLPRDLFGGITNNQLGGGHSSEYWFKGNRRISQVSREAFAGYFEYKTTITDPVFQDCLINPYQCMPNTAAALDALFNVILKG